MVNKGKTMKKPVKKKAMPKGKARGKGKMPKDCE
jgi:hypothetical protein